MSEICQWTAGCRNYSRNMQTATSTVAGPAYLIRLDSPIGRIEVTADDEAITSLRIERGGHLPWEHLPETPNSILEAARMQLLEYFAGFRRDFDLPVRLVGTEFQRRVWDELRAVPYGDVLSYGQLGAATGRPTAGRAVGGAVGANPVPIIVPCHRVLASDKRITGYSAGEGIPTKTWLLDHEGIAHR